MDLPENPNVVAVAQLVRAPDCDSGGRGFKSPRSPHQPINLDLWKEAAELVHRQRQLYAAYGRSYEGSTARTYDWLAFLRSSIRA